MELKEGMYVRLQEFDYTIIAKIVELDKEYDGFKADNDMYYINQNILKSSDNTIDLIEVGDYVNGKEVVRIFTNVFNNQKVLVCLQNEKKEDFDYSDDISDYMSDEFIHIYNEDIKSIVTKEYFDSGKYEVE